jgi:hypothetical protein
MSSARNTRGNRFAHTSIRRIPLRSLTVPPSSLSPCHSDIALTDSVLAVAETVRTLISHPFFLLFSSFSQISLGRPIPVHGVCPDPPPRFAPSPRILADDGAPVSRTSHAALTPTFILLQ